jgi:hypothetical protein
VAIWSVQMCTRQVGSNTRKKTPNDGKDLTVPLGVEDSVTLRSMGDDFGSASISEF